MNKRGGKLFMLWFNAAIIIPPLLCATIGHAKDASRILLGLMVVVLAALGKRVWDYRLDDKGGPAQFLRWYPALFLTASGSYLLARVFLGDHGVDFVVFSQAIANVSRVGAPIVDLLNTERSNFLSHHFSPVIYIIGALGYLGIPGYLAGILAQIASIAAGLLALSSIASQLGHSRALARAIVGLFCVTPSLVGGATWAIHDEIFALGFVGWAICFFLQGRHWRSALMLLLTMLCKETFFIFAALFSLMAFFTLSGQGKRLKLRAPYALICLLGITGAFLYFVVRPHFSPATFHPLERVVSWQELMNLSALRQKACYILCLLIPTLALGLRSPMGLLILLCGVPFWGASLLSNFPEMWKLNNYYAVLPAYLLAVGALITLERLGKTNFQQIPAVYFSCLVLLCVLLGPSLRPAKTVFKLTSRPVFVPRSLDFIPAGAKVVASDFDALFVPESCQVFRAWTAARAKLPWDLLLVRKPSKEEIAPKLLEASVPCYEDSSWRLYCRKGTDWTRRLHDSRPG